MLGYFTEIDIKKKVVRTVFGKQINTFVFDEQKFPPVEAMKVSAEHAHGLMLEFLRGLADFAEHREEIWDKLTAVMLEDPKYFAEHRQEIQDKLTAEVLTHYARSKQCIRHAWCRFPDGYDGDCRC